jgi:hypothetical protein
MRGGGDGVLVAVMDVLLVFVCPVSEVLLRSCARW